MSKHDVIVTLKELREFSREATQIASGRIRSDLEGDRSFRRHAERIVELIGEAANRLPREVQQRYPTIPWKQIVGMRNWLAHGYDGVDYDILWDVLSNHAPALVKQLDAIIEAESKTTP